MWIHGIVGLIIGFCVGLAASAYCVRHIPRETLRRNRDLRFRYGLLIWGIAFSGMALALSIRAH